MTYYKQIESGYIVAFGQTQAMIQNTVMTEISAEEYAMLSSLLKSKPVPNAGMGYRLREDLTWEGYELPPVEDEEIMDDVALAELMEVLNDDPQ